MSDTLNHQVRNGVDHGKVLNCRALGAAVSLPNGFYIDYNVKTCSSKGNWMVLLDLHRRLHLFIKTAS